MAKSAAFVPESVAEPAANVRLAVPLLSTLTVCTPLVVWTSWLLNAKPVGVSVTACPRAIAAPAIAINPVARLRGCQEITVSTSGQ